MTKLSRMSYIASLAILVSACASNSIKLSDLKAVEYSNANKQGETIVVLPGEIKTSNGEFSSKYTAENIADFGEIELARANFVVLERKTRTAAVSGLRSAIETGDAEYVKNKPANFTEARWIVKFDVLKAEPVSESKSSFSGETAGKIIGFLLEGAGAVVPYMSALANSSKAVASASTSMGKYYTGLVSNVAGGVGKNVAETAGAAIHSSSASSVWIVGIRYKVLDPTTTKQVATGYVEQKMEIQEVGASGPVSDSSTTYHAGVDSIIQRIVQMHVKEIDRKFK